MSHIAHRAPVTAPNRKHRTPNSNQAVDTSPSMQSNIHAENRLRPGSAPTQTLKSVGNMSNSSLAETVHGGHTAVSGLDEMSLSLDNNTDDPLALSARMGRSRSASHETTDSNSSQPSSNASNQRSAQFSQTFLGQAFCCATKDSDSIRSSSSKKMIKLFPEISADEVTLNVYNCAIEKDILWQGKLYSTTNYLCFHSIVFGKTERLVVKWLDIISIEKKMTASVFPNAIKVTTLEGKHTFASFLYRDTAHAEISAHWKSVKAHARTDQGTAYRHSTTFYRREGGYMNEEPPPTPTEMKKQSAKSSSAINIGANENAVPLLVSSMFSSAELIRRPRTVSDAEHLLPASKAAQAGRPRAATIHSPSKMASTDKPAPGTVESPTETSRTSAKLDGLVTSPSQSAFSCISNLESKVTVPPGMSLLYNPSAAARLQKKDAPTILRAESKIDEVRDSEEGDNNKQSGDKKPQKSNAGAANTNNSSKGGAPNRGTGASPHQNPNDGNEKGGGGGSSGSHPHVTIGTTNSKLAANCPCEKHEGILLVNQVLPHSLRGTFEKVMKEECSAILAKAYEACRSDGLVFWSWRTDAEKNWAFRDVEYTSHFDESLNSGVLCKERQEVVFSHEDYMVMNFRGSTIQKVGTVNVSFTQRLCWTYEAPHSFRLKIHSKPDTDTPPDMVRAITTRNHLFANALCVALSGVQTPSPVPEVKAAARTSSLPTTPTPIVASAEETDNVLFSSKFWVSSANALIVEPTISVGKMLGVLVPINESGKAPTTTTTHATNESKPNEPASSSLLHTVSSLITNPSINTKMLGLAMLAVMFGLSLTVLNIVWMAELSDRLERTLDAVRVARERNAVHVIPVIPPVAKAVVAADEPVEVVEETMAEIRKRLVEHSENLMDALPISLAKSLDSMEKMKETLVKLRHDLITGHPKYGGGVPKSDE
ncbi:hypothetical protein BJ741DRAFT_606415 [Chytriomyces cf. hyalinus JEL632]|nr:hypothetical protein BJ741DRAFT_606415 [Chytriomyces cf. hyalinus JEL632]